jgi:uncharacterized repeat protein (TIGR02543 family)
VKTFLKFHLLHVRIWEIVFLFKLLCNTAWANYSLDYALSGIETTSSVSHSYEIESGWGYRTLSNQAANSYYISEEIEAFLDLFFDSVKPKTLLSNGVSLGNGWMQRDWFGVYYATSYPWVYHANLGWSYIKEQESNQAWVYRELLGWLWAERNSFPHLYMDEREEWTYLDLRQARATLYDYRYGEWFELGKTYSIEAEAFPLNGGTIQGTGIYHRWEKVILQASPADNYTFAGWLQDSSGTGANFEFEATQDVFLASKFAPKLNTGASAAELTQSIKTFLDDRSDLSEKDKSIVLAELLITGISETAGISFAEDGTFTLPIEVSANTSPQQQIAEIKEQLDLLTDISEEQKNKALAEILIYGNSPSLGLSLSR